MHQAQRLRSDLRSKVITLISFGILNLALVALAFFLFKTDAQVSYMTRGIACPDFRQYRVATDNGTNRYCLYNLHSILYLFLHCLLQTAWVVPLIGYSLATDAMAREFRNLLRQTLLRFKWKRAAALSPPVLIEDLKCRYIELAETADGIVTKYNAWVGAAFLGQVPMIIFLAYAIGESMMCGFL